MKRVLDKWKFVSGVVSITIALCSYFMCGALASDGNSYGAVYAMYVGVTIAVAGIASIAFSISNKEAMTVVFYMYISAAFGVVIVMAWQLWSMIVVVLWCIVCSVLSYRVMRFCE